MPDIRADWYVMGPRLRLIRVKVGLSVEEVCERTGIVHTSLYAYEAGRTEPKSTALLALCAVYDFDPRGLVL